MNTTIQSFTGPQASCPKCDNGSRQSLSAAYPGMGQSALRVRYCPGGKEPEEQEENPLTAFLHMVMQSDAFAGKLRSLPVKRINICAGIGAEHLHVTCVDCGYEWLTETKETADSVKAAIASLQPS